MPTEVQSVMKFTRLTEHALPPVKGSDKAAGFDLKRYYMFHFLFY